MPINERFRDNYKKVGMHKGHIIWKLEKSHNKLGIHGTKVAVDLDICNGCLKCLKKCTVNVFTELETPNHPVSKIKADPINENDCFECLVCLMICPVQAIDIKQERNQSDTLDSLLNY
ncbi:MAG: ferredoxin [Candidatus Lokiarchaeota archaeon]|nr:ferredoxin [Candidatus Lokiarchaeota archaeon]